MSLPKMKGYFIQGRSKSKTEDPLKKPRIIIVEIFFEELSTLLRLPAANSSPPLWATRSGEL